MQGSLAGAGLTPLWALEALVSWGALHHINSCTARQQQRDSTPCCAVAALLLSTAVLLDACYVAVLQLLKPSRCQELL